VSARTGGKDFRWIDGRRERLEGGPLAVGELFNRLQVKLHRDAFR